tara:strand:- start:451 stop:579 length:129 start_codon:yes stop_codon:yes gene_type:complete
VFFSPSESVPESPPLEGAPVEGLPEGTPLEAPATGEAVEEEE